MCNVRYVCLAPGDAAASSARARRANAALPTFESEFLGESPGGPRISFTRNSTPPKSRVPFE